MCLERLGRLDFRFVLGSSFHVNDGVFGRVIILVSSWCTKNGVMRLRDCYSHTRKIGLIDTKVLKICSCFIIFSVFFLEMPLVCVWSHVMWTREVISWFVWFSRLVNHHHDYYVHQSTHTLLHIRYGWTPSYLFNHALLKLLGNIITRVFCMIFLWKGDVQPVPVVVEAEVLGHPNILLATKRNHRSKGGWIMLNQSSRKKGSPRILWISTHPFRIFQVCQVISR